MIPIELYRGVVDTLDIDADRLTLLSVAQCCSVLRDESQRVLFRSTASEIWIQGDIIHKHKLFLQAVIASPQRLALYVKEFIQFGIGWEPGYRSDLLENSLDYEERSDVYRNTMLALPVMVKLERLRYRPLYGRPSAHILRQCTFQLQVLQWAEWAALTREDDLMFFLSTQASLRHLSVGWIKNPTFGLAKNILPKLISVQGGPSTLMVLSEAVGPRQILAFDCLEDTWPIKYSNRAMNVVSGLKYLRTNNTSTLRNVIQACNGRLDSIVVLEVTWRVKTEVQLLQYLPPALRVLILQHHEYSGDAPLQNDMKRAALAAFTQCSSLQYADFYTLTLSTGYRVPHPSSSGGHLRVTPLNLPSGGGPMNWWKRHRLDDS